MARREQPRKQLCGRLHCAPLLGQACTHQQCSASAVAIGMPLAGVCFVPCDSGERPTCPKATSAAHYFLLAAMLLGPATSRASSGLVYQAPARSMRRPCRNYRCFFLSFLSFSFPSFPPPAATALGHPLLSHRTSVARHPPHPHPSIATQALPRSTPSYETACTPTPFGSSPPPSFGIVLGTTVSRVPSVRSALGYT